MTSHTLWLLRHGLSTGNRDRVRQGQRDYPLTNRGRRQAEQLADSLVRDSISFQAIIASPLARAKETADIIAGALGMNVETDDRWMERHGGAAEGQPLEAKEFPLSARPALRAQQPIFEGGESRVDLHLRAASALQDVLRRPAGNYLIVAHGGILSETIRTLLGLSPTGACSPPSFRFENCAYARMSFHDGRGAWIVDHVNETGHLKST